MSDSIQIHEEHFSLAQIAIKELGDYTSKCNGRSVVTFRYEKKPYLLPYFYKGNESLEFANWDGHFMREDVIKINELLSTEVMGVEIPAVTAQISGVWYDVEPRRIRGCLIRRSSDSLIFVLVKPTTEYCMEMTQNKWGPVYVGEETDPFIFG
ncbi:hypothetical protein [Gimesia aquarii]|uniref:Uncharacterized protein n=1 Tax=Gimesia aquarii TaxID=2527964 RepID=A0A517W3N9_9PLAN|nr:hypothetical protein [Gimesia aquarii]QDT99875.1 hypothetical protein V144x_53890 [Gimesia aquarii]